MKYIFRSDKMFFLWKHSIVVMALFHSIGISVSTKDKVLYRDEDNIVINLNGQPSHNIEGIHQIRVQVTSFHRQLDSNESTIQQLKEAFTNLQTKFNSTIKEKNILIEANRVAIQEKENEVKELNLKIKQQINNNKLLETQLKNKDNELKLKESLMEESEIIRQQKEEEIKRIQQNSTNFQEQLESSLEREKKHQSTIKEKDILIEANRVAIQEQMDEIKELKLKNEQQIIESANHKLALETQLKDQDNELKLKIKLIEERQIEIKNLTEQKTADSGLIKDQNVEIAKYKQMKCLPRGCPNETTNGVHSIEVLGIDEPFMADCDATINGPGWIVVQRRIDETVSFDRTWADYRTGFGDNQGNYFIGLEKLHLMTHAQPYELYIHLESIEKGTLYARYDNFTIGSESESYELKSVGKYTGNAGDALSNHVKFIFQTRDRNTGTRCATDFGAWWFIQHGGCGKSQLNAKHFDGSYSSIFWNHWGSKVSYKLVQMMIRKK